MTEDHRHPEAASAAEGSAGMFRIGRGYRKRKFFSHSSESPMLQIRNATITIR
jgi:hypothetical protein